MSKKKAKNKSKTNKGMDIWGNGIFLGTMKHTKEAEKSLNIFSRNGLGTCISNGERVVVLSDELTLLEGRELAYDNFGVDVEKSELYQKWFAKRANISSLKEQEEMMAGISHENRLHMMAAMGLPDICKKFIEAGDDLNKPLTFHPVSTPNEIDEELITPLGSICWLLRFRSRGFPTPENVIRTIRTLVDAGSEYSEKLISFVRKSLGREEIASILEAALLKRKSGNSNVARLCHGL